MVLFRSLQVYLITCYSGSVCRILGYGHALYEIAVFLLGVIKEFWVLIRIPFICTIGVEFLLESLGGIDRIFSCRVGGLVVDIYASLRYEKYIRHHYNAVHYHFD